MTDLDIVMLVCLAGAAAALLVIDIRLIKALRAAKDKVILPEIWDFVFMVLFAAGTSCCYAVDNMSPVVYVLALIVTVLYLPCAFTVVTPVGIIVPEIKKDCLRPAEKYSYDYTQCKVIKEVLNIYYNNGRPFKLYIGIKSTKLITMLNDNYEKHGYENPMLRGG
ncbi:hypothetical protein [Ruminococcus albus]|uniref:Uncharacterized protein n=1 Tax=Ruminococcus albus (strain ATCC 27210 / DSM 20455 / JCM 14654 / NCDO 2250 / 7) TaxID=697329 RepID=E6UCA0_RUMA7|nr:hypothetical protein [Ruminococcus albus]ADU20692.1 hypothetical protein Rumal_0130 [Ruminococcus albus 7 = DSM 20455]